MLTSFFVVHGYHPEDNAALHGLQLPGDDVAVVLHRGDDDLVARLHLRQAEGGGQEVDALRGAAGEDDFVGGAGVDELAHGLAAGLMQFRGLLGEEVHAAVHVGVGVVILVGDGLDHTAGFLRRGAVVQVDQGLAVDGAAQDGEVGAYLLDVVHIGVFLSDCLRKDTVFLKKIAFFCKDSPLWVSK